MKTTALKLAAISGLLLLATMVNAQTMVNSSKGVDFLYDVYDAVGGGYKVKLIIANNTGKVLVTSGYFRLDFKGGGWIQMGAATIQAYDEKQFVYEGKYKNYPEVAKWKTPAFSFK